MYRIIWTEPAIEDLTRIKSYIRECNPQVAETVGDAIEKKAAELDHFPYRGFDRGEGYRGLIVRDKYTIEYLIEDDYVAITAIYVGALPT